MEILTTNTSFLNGIIMVSKDFKEGSWFLEAVLNMHRGSENGHHV